MKSRKLLRNAKLGVTSHLKKVLLAKNRTA